MSFNVLIFEEEGGFWAKVPALLGCSTQGDTEEELMANVREAIQGWLSAHEEEAMAQALASNSAAHKTRELVFA